MAARIEGIVELLAARMPKHMIGGMRRPGLKAATFGDSSGVRGAAMLAARTRAGGYTGDAVPLT